MNKLAFVIAGAQKSGTTTLDAIFREHPQIQMASVKETHFFDDEHLDWRSPDYGALDAYFARSDDRLRGEATPVTMYWRPAVRRLHEYNPEIRIIVILRDPVTRAYSNWRMEQVVGRETLSFSQAIREGRYRVQRQGTTEGLHRFVAYIERSQYGEQLDYLTSYFPKRNVHCEIFEEFFHDRSAGLDRIANFLNIDPFPADIAELQLNSGQTESSIPLPEDIEFLAELFQDQVKSVEQFLGRPVASWSRRVPVPAATERSLSVPTDRPAGAIGTL
jgi:hypothetical protein